MNIPNMKRRIANIEKARAQRISTLDKCQACGAIREPFDESYGGTEDYESHIRYIADYYTRPCHVCGTESEQGKQLLRLYPGKNGKEDFIQAILATRNVK
jgi:hypothetical protein